MPSEIEFVIGNAETLQRIGEQRPYEIFAGQTIDFLQELSAALRRPARAGAFSDVAAFGFWCRRAGVLEMKKRYDGESRCRVGRGVSLHFVSSNLPVLFGFSMAAALLAGDSVLLRLPSKRTPQEDILVGALRAVMEKQPAFQGRIVLFRSPHDREITDALSACCDVRVIWGGDSAVQEIRRSPLPPRATELPFADRRSAALLSAEAVLCTEDLTGLIRDFYNDTYRNDQNACSSPHLLYWLGEHETARRARERFWDAAEQMIKVRRDGEPAESVPAKHAGMTADSGQTRETVRGRVPAGHAGMTYPIRPEIAVKKWEQALYLAAAPEAQGFHGNEEPPAVRISRRGNLAILVEPGKLSAQLWEQTVPGGFFFQGEGSDVTPLLPALSRKVQTLACFGVNRREIAAQLAAAGVTGVDRIVEIGHALDFSLVWDGMDLIGQLSREIVV